MYQLVNKDFSMHAFALFFLNSTFIKYRIKLEQGFTYNYLFNIKINHYEGDNTGQVI